MIVTLLLLLSVVIMLVRMRNDPAQLQWWARFFRNRRALLVWAAGFAVLLALSVTSVGLDDWYTTIFTALFAGALGLLIAIVYEAVTRRSDIR